mgnify:CR=1 FL=1
MKIKIEKNIPLPQTKPEIKYAFLEEFKVGDSCRYLKERRTGSDLHEYAKKINIKILTKTIDKKNKIIRIWRVK